MHVQGLEALAEGEKEQGGSRLNGHTAAQALLKDCYGERLPACLPACLVPGCVAVCLPACGRFGVRASLQQWTAPLACARQTLSWLARPRKAAQPASS